MPDVWMPDLIHDPGRGAGYAVGHISVDCVKVHRTAGSDSYGLVKNGTASAPSTLAQFLVPYAGVPWQFTEVDARCYDSGPYNGFGPGIEIESPVTGGLIRPGLSEFRDLSPDQTYWTGRIFHWLHDEWGIDLELYDGPRFPDVAQLRCFVNHGDIDANRSDGVTREEWDACIAGDDLNEQQTRDLIDEHLFAEHPELGGYSRFTSKLEDYLNTPTGYGLTRVGLWLLADIKKHADKFKQALGI